MLAMHTKLYAPSERATGSLVKTTAGFHPLVLRVINGLKSLADLFIRAGFRPPKILYANSYRVIPTDLHILLPNGNQDLLWQPCIPFQPGNKIPH